MVFPVGGGAYSLKLAPAQFEQFKTAGYFNGLKLQATVEPSEFEICWAFSSRNFRPKLLLEIYITAIDNDKLIYGIEENINLQIRTN